jgi:CubicO group peptidase (beta-lactamase class C family)
MNDLEESVDRVAAETGFSGVVRVDCSDGADLAKAYGLAHRGHWIATTVDTQFAIASGGKGLTALTVVSLIEAGMLDAATTARSVLGNDLPLIGKEVTVEQLLAHRSGIGDYVDEEAGNEITDYVLPVPVHELAATEQFLRVLDGYPAKFTPGQRFSYCNSGYVVLALMAEQASGIPFHDLVEQRVCEPAGMQDTQFLRSDELPGRAALGYLATDGLRTNVFHLPVRGSGDGVSTPPRRTSTLCGPRSSPVGSSRHRLGGRDGAPAQRCAGRVHALRPGVLAPRVARGGDAGGIRRRSVLPDRPRSGRGLQSHGALEHVGRYMADHAPPRQTPHALRAVRAVWLATRSVAWCSASNWSAPVGSSLLRWDAPSVASGPVGSSG